LFFSDLPRISGNGGVKFVLDALRGRAEGFFLAIKRPVSPQFRFENHNCPETDRRG